MKVTVSKETYDYFKKLLDGSGQKLIENWQHYINYGKETIYWNGLYDKVYKEVGFSSAQMVAKLLRGEIELEKPDQTRFVFYKKQAGKRRYYGAFEEVTTATKATWYNTELSHDERQMEALETLGWIKISLEQAQEEDK